MFLGIQNINFEKNLCAWLCLPKKGLIYNNRIRETGELLWK